jgi:Secreted and surface protein containing fasciclin-like repeats
MKTAEKSKDVLRTAGEDGSFTLFTKAATETGLDAVLSGAKEITVFAPVDEAFEPLSAEERLLLFEDAEKLRNLLLYHIVPGHLSIAEVMGLTSVRTLGGQALTINACDGFTIEDANVVKADIACANGIIHGIDRILSQEKK